MNSFGGSKAAAEGLAAVLQRLYRTRFSADDLGRMRKVWRVLVRRFFQKRIRRESTVLDIGAGPCLFINEVQARRRIARDANPDVREYAAYGVEAVVIDNLSLDEIVDETIDSLFEQSSRALARLSGSSGPSGAGPSQSGFWRRASRPPAQLPARPRALLQLRAGKQRYARAVKAAPAN